MRINSSALCAIIAAAVRAVAADSSVQVSGKVISADGITLTAAKVKIVELQLTAETDNAGQFTFPEIPAGKFAIVASKEGYAPIVAHIAVSGPTKIDFELPASPVRYDTLVVTGSGALEPLSTLSRSIGVIDQRDLESNRAVGFDETLNQIPGVKAESQALTEEVRISVRGRSERTTFGVRGIKILVDGIPETDASGETTDFVGVDLGAIDRLEVVKGPMSALYGANSSGVIQAFTRRGGATPALEYRSMFGSFGFNREEASFSGGARKLFFALNGSHTGQTGYRDHSKLGLNHFTGRVDYELGGRTEISFFGRVGDLESQLPGNLTRQQMIENPWQASPNFLRYDSQSNITRYQGATRISHSLSAYDTISGSYYGRSLEYELPAPNIFINGLRREQGGSGKYASTRRLGSLVNFFEAGAHYQFQHEDRMDFNNAFGVRGTIVQRKENRHVDNQSYFAFDRLQLTRKLDLIGGVNYSRVRFTVDNLLSNPVVSTGPLFDQGSYQVAAAYHVSSALSLYANTSTGFEPPTITEFGRDPTGAPGLNLALKPQSSRAHEGGLLARLGTRAYLNIAVFRVRVSDEIVPTGIGYPQVSYMNAGRTVHNGAEVGLQVAPFRGFELNSAFTYSDFYYDRFINVVSNFSGNRLPGIPRARLYSVARYTHRSGLYGAFENQYVARFYANDANTARNDQYALSSLSAGYRKSFEAFELTCLFRADNLTNRRYSGYVVVNDQFGAYYYPGAPRNYTGVIGMTVHLPRFLF